MLHEGSVFEVHSLEVKAALPLAHLEGIHMENNELASGSSQCQHSQRELVNKQMGMGRVGE